MNLKDIYLILKPSTSILLKYNNKEVGYKLYKNKTEYDDKKIKKITHLSKDGFVTVEVY